MTHRRRGMMIIVALIIVFVLGAFASALVVMHSATFRAETAGRAHVQAALAARGVLEVVRDRLRARRIEPDEVPFADGQVLFSVEPVADGYRVLLDARFKTTADVPIRREFVAVLRNTADGLKLVAWNELPGPSVHLPSF